MMPTRQACEAQQASQLLGHSGWGIVVAGWSAGGIIPLEELFLSLQTGTPLFRSLNEILSFLSALSSYNAFQFR